MRRAILIILSFCYLLPSYSQKVKYKDIYVQLQAKRFDESEPYLREFIFNPKNDDHANAHLQMGYLFENKLLKADILRDTANLYGWADSSALYFSKAREFIDEKELKKNDEYYQAFYRRDLRTGDFGIKISDVHLEIEDKIKSVKSRGENIYDVNENLKLANQSYNTAIEKFMHLNSQYNNFNDFLLKSTPQVKEEVTAIASSGKDSKGAIEKMRTALSLIEDPGFGPEFKYKPITDFPQLGISKADFYNSEFDLWNVEEWASDAVNRIENDIEPLRTDIVAYHRELTDYKAGLFSGGSNGRGALSFDPKILNEISKYDEKSILKDIFKLLLEDINILKIYSADLNKLAADKENIDYQLLVADSIVNKYVELTNAIASLSSRDLEKEYPKYKFFFDGRMSGKSGLEEFIAEQTRNVTDQKAYWESQYDFWLETSQWGIMEFGSIPLNPVDTLIPYPLEDASYIPLAIARDDSLNIYATGLELGSKPNGYIALVAQNREGEWYKKIDLGKMAIADTAVVATSQFVVAGEGLQTFYFYSPISQADNFVICNVDQTGKILWRNPLQLDKKPFDIRYNETVFETILYMDDPENPPADGLVYIVIDRSGKVRQ
ncbi:MAG: hypothetical protein RJQ09_15430 [Cyclobacteriaceae bacterium]